MNGWLSTVCDMREQDVKKVTEGQAEKALKLLMHSKRRLNNGGPELPGHRPRGLKQAPNNRLNAGNDIASGEKRLADPMREREGGRERGYFSDKGSYSLCQSSSYGFVQFVVQPHLQFCHAIELT
jgi:hypothetical protein